MKMALKIWRYNALAGERALREYEVDAPEWATLLDVLDLGTDRSEPRIDYPDKARELGEALLAGDAERGVLVCGSGVGAAVAANKLTGIRASICHDTYSAHQGVEHDDMNVLTLGARVIGPEPAYECALAFLAAVFSGEPRHRRRLDKVLAIEAAAADRG